MTRVEIIIEEVVLRGVPAEQAADVVAGLQRALAELAGDPAGLTALRGSDTPSVAHRGRPPVAADARALGELTAARVWNSITGGGRA